MTRPAAVHALWQDLRYGARQLRLASAFTTVATLSLALGIGANTAIFQLLDAVRLRALPVRAPGELLEIRITNTADGRTGSFRGRRSQLTQPLWEQLQAGQQGFSGTVAWGTGVFDLAAGGEARYAQGIWVSGDFFHVLGVPAALGRVFSAADDQIGCGSPGAVLGNAFWQRQYGGDVSVVGRTLQLDGHPFEIVGVASPRFFGLEVGRRFDVAIPLCSEAVLRGEHSGIGKTDVWWLGAIGRLKPGWSARQAAEQLAALSPGVFRATLSRSYAPDDARNYLAFKLDASPAASGVSELRRDYETPLWLLLGIAALVLTIACANLANLQVARASGRQREMAVRLALGASRGRLLRQLLAESLLLAAAGALLGMWLALALSRSLLAFLSTESDRLYLDLGAGWHVLAFTSVLAVGACLAFGVAPALRATRTPAGAVLKASGRGLTASRERHGQRRSLVVVQVALSLVLVVNAVLFVRSLRNLTRQDPGFRPGGILVADLDLRRVNVPAERRRALYREILDRLTSLPGVESAAAAAIVPVSGSGWNDYIVSDGRGGRKPKALANVNQVSTGFFRTLGTPLLSGRDFDERDVLAAPRVAIVNQTFARELLREPNPVGASFEMEQRPGEPRRIYQVVGLVKDTKYGELREEFTPIAYLPSQQDEEPGPSVSLLVRSSVPLEGVTAAVTRAIAAASPEISLSYTVFETQLRESLLRERLMATLSGFFGALAALLATIGLYGVMSYMVARRTSEIGLRMALGADRRHVLRMVMGEAATLTGAGLVVGSALAVAGAQAAKALLFGLQPHDASTLAIAAAGLTSVALLASYLPAARAARVEPTVALREE
jgi:predicted permease